MSVVRTLIGNIRGPQGVQGETGATGAPGANGTNGQDGAAATVQVGTTTTAAYGTNASVTNSGTESAAVLDFVIPQGAPGEEVTDASDLTLNEITASSANYPTFTVQEQLKSIFGKIQKFLSDLKDKYVSKSMISTSTNISTAGQAVADAVAIKSLNDALATSQGNYNSGVYGTDVLSSDLETLALSIEYGTVKFLRISSSAAASYANLPSGYNYGFLILHKISGNLAVILFFPISSTDTRKPLFKMYASNTWGAWHDFTGTAVS